MNKQKSVDVMCDSHPAAKVTRSFSNMRENCVHYRGIKEHIDSLQCTHKKSVRGYGNWCAMDLCPLLRERMQKIVI